MGRLHACAGWAVLVHYVGPAGPSLFHTTSQELVVTTVPVVVFFNHDRNVEPVPDKLTLTLPLVPNRPAMRHCAPGALEHFFR